MIHATSEKDIKETNLSGILVTKDVKGTPIVDSNVKQHLCKNKRVLAMNHEEALKFIHENLGHIFGSFIRFWGILYE